MIDIGIFLSPKNFSSVSISNLKVSSKNYRDQNLSFRKFQPEKRLPKILKCPFQDKNPLKWAIIPFFRCSKILGEARKQEILQQMFRNFQISNRLPNRYFPKIDVRCPLLLSQPKNYVVYLSNYFRKKFGFAITFREKLIMTHRTQGDRDRNRLKRTALENFTQGKRFLRLRQVVAKQKLSHDTNLTVFSQFI